MSLVKERKKKALLFRRESGSVRMKGDCIFLRPFKPFLVSLKEAAAAVIENGMPHLRHS